MPRPLVYGNGSMLLQLDRNGDIRDFFWPTVGLLNHLQGYKIRMGVWVDGQFAWLESDGWERRQGYRPEALIGDSTYTHEGLGVSLHVAEAMDPTSPTWVRRVTVTALRDGLKEVRLFFNHDLRIAESDIGDTAFYHPFSDSVVHYKRKFAFLFGGRGDNGGLFEYTTGIKAFKDFHGTLWDVHDGHLEKVPINQGSVDSTLSLAAEFQDGRCALDYWIACGESIDAAENTQSPLSLMGGLSWVEGRVQKAAAKAPPGVSMLSQDTARFYTRSLDLIETQCDSGGAILAANDSDILETNRATYGFVWPRDGALVAMVTDKAHRPQISGAFFDFCCRILPEDRPAFLHKYGPDGSLGASWHPWLMGDSKEVPIQQDESALTVIAIAKHLKRFPESPSREIWFRKLVKPLCSFLRSDVADNGLPLPSWDLWEERRGTHCYTVATTISALEQAAKLAMSLGEDRAAESMRTSAGSMKGAMLEQLWDREEGRFFRMLDATGVPDRAADCATLCALHHRILDPKSNEAKQLVDFIADKLELKGGIGGVARYEHDYYFRRSEAYPGNPWVICTMWLAQARLQMGDIQAAEDALQWVMDRAEPTGVLAEQYHPETGEPLSVSPLTWSHAEFCRTVQWLQEAKSHAS